MTINLLRLVSSSFLLVATAAGLAIAAPAEAQYAQQRPAAQQRIAEGTHQWGQDNWCYVVQGGRWVRTAYFRRFPDQRNYPQVFDIYLNGQFVKRAGAVAAQTQTSNRRPTADELRLQQLVNELNRQTAVARAQAGAGTPGLASSVLGGNYSPVTPGTGGLASSVLGGGIGPGLPGLSVAIGGPRTPGEVIYNSIVNGRPVFLEPNCNTSRNGCR